MMQQIQVIGCLKRLGIHRSSLVGLILVLSVGVVAVFSSALLTKHSMETKTPPRRRLTDSSPSSLLPNTTVTVYTQALDTPIGRKQRQDLVATAERFTNEKISMGIVSLTFDQMRPFVETKCNDDGTVLKAWDRMVQEKQEHLAVELWKYCALSLASEGEGVLSVYVDASSPLVVSLTKALRPALSNHAYKSIAVWGEQSYFSQTIHGSLLALTPKQNYIAKEMLKVLSQTNLAMLATAPLLLARSLYALISVDISPDNPHNLEIGQNMEKWVMLSQTCHIDPLRRSGSSSWTEINSYRLAHHCPLKSGFCCSIQDERSQTILMTTHPLLPYQVIPDSLKRPYNAEIGHYDEEEIPFIATVREEVFRRPEDYPATPNFFDTLFRNDCLPSADDCNKCLRNKNGADCNTCASQCLCYCKTLCKEKVEEKFVSKNFYVSLPLFSRDPNRLIPRIVHQTWFEDVSQEKYPNMSRLVESFRRSGWEYKFYSDDEAGNFLSTHFPAEVREAYDALRPGAFKADLFRYCVLLIHGGVYADVDIMLESSLDHAVEPDVGFMVPFDEPGIPVEKRMCLWNGLIAAAPGHPFLLKAIETVVNQVRNRFTSVDTDASFCPNPELSILHAFDTLFTAGPCLLGSSINRVLGRHGQTGFHAGELDVLQELKGNGVSLEIPGKTIILDQNKWDMGAHRFTHLERNLVVAATDLPDADDRRNLDSESEGSGGGVHYSKTHAKTGIYGLEGLYTDKRQANEDIHMFLDPSSESRHVVVAAAK